MKNNLTKTISIAVVILLLAWAAYWKWGKSGNPMAPGVDVTAGGEQYQVPELTKPYVNDDFAFSIKIPDTFSVQEFQTDASTVIVLDGGEGTGVQILITPYGEDVKTFTADMIRQDLPELKISDVQPVEVGESHRGLAFRSDSADFGGASREVWFVFEGNLYQISTYERLDDLLKAIFGTWQFSRG